jgi:hypothetical protein
MAAFRKLTVNTLDALAVAVAVYQKFDNHVMQGESRDAILDHFTNKTKLDITSEHVELANKVKSIIAHKIMMTNLLAIPNFGVPSTSTFIEKIDKLLAQETITSKDFSFIAWAPNVAEKITKADNDKERILSIGVNSQFVGKLSKKIELTYHEVFCRWLPNWDTFVYTGHDDNENLINFFSKSKIPSGSTITAKVKAYKVDAKLANSNITVLSYVKVKQ